MRYVLLFAFLLPRLLSAQDISGDWQGALKFGNTENRLVVTIVKNSDGGWSASEVTPDDGSNPVVANSVSFDGRSLRISFDRLPAVYEGRLNTDRNSFKGTLTEGTAFSLDLDHATTESSWRRDQTAHKTQFVTVEPNVKLEVLDWGGTGEPVVLLAGGNNTAHSFDKFAPKLIAWYHVYGITRRGSGVSSNPPPTQVNYAADRLGDDILAVIGSLKLDRPILVGHSLAGEELSSVGSRYPDKVAALIYLDAGYSYAYDPSLSSPSSSQPPHPITTVDQAIRAGMQKYTRIDLPILAIYALPHDRGITDPAKRAEADSSDLAFQGAMAKAFEKGLPSARVIWLPHANHYVFRSNEVDVIREMNKFVGNLSVKSAVAHQH